MNWLALAKSAVLAFIRKRSPKWPAVEKAHLHAEPFCRWCGGTTHLQVHHELPFHLFPQYELDPAKLLTMCMAPDRECHLRIAHLGSWLRFDPDIREKCNAHSKEHPPCAPSPASPS